MVEPACIPRGGGGINCETDRDGGSGQPIKVAFTGERSPPPPIALLLELVYKILEGCNNMI